MNKVILVGRLTKEPELRQMPNGESVLANAIAVNRDYTNQQGEREADFINFVAFRNTAERINKYVRKGYRLGLEGRWQRRSYVNNNNQTVYVDELIVEKVEFLQDKPQNDNSYDDYNQSYNNNNSYQQRNNNQYGNNSNYNQQNNQFANTPNQYEITDDDLPF